MDTYLKSDLRCIKKDIVFVVGPEKTKLLNNLKRALQRG